MHYKDILTSLGIDERELAIVFGYGGKDPKQTMWSSSPYQKGRIQRFVQFLFDHFAAASPKLTPDEAEQRQAGPAFLLEIIRRNGVDVSHFERLQSYIKEHAKPDDPDDAKIIQAERDEWGRLLKNARLI